MLVTRSVCVIERARSQNSLTNLQISAPSAPQISKILFLSLSYFQPKAYQLNFTANWMMRGSRAPRI
jgi:hypothetical protein